ncbi:MAG: ADP-ribose-binding protein [Desulfuromonas sp.]|nr:MAG: ADP-ribose-binding protein [Desulfuromonas sp.]
MQLIGGDLWEFHRQGAVIAVTTGGLVKKDGSCAMPNGCARQAAERYPKIPYVLGEQIRHFGMHVFDLGNRIVAFPVENSPYENPELGIIARSCRELVELADYKGWCDIVVPRPGCGMGGLQWKEVAPILAAHFDERFRIIDKLENVNNESS